MGNNCLVHESVSRPFLLAGALSHARKDLVHGHCPVRLLAAHPLLALGDFSKYSWINWFGDEYNKAFVMVMTACILARLTS